MGEDPEAVMMQIRSIQQSLRELQTQVIGGQITPQEYQRIERERIAQIHELEAKLAALGGEAEPERETDL